MSKRNGDRARFEKERQKKMLRRENTLALRKTVASSAEGPVGATPTEPKAANTGVN